MAALTPDTIEQAVTSSVNFSYGAVGQWMVYVLISICLLAFFWFIYSYMMHNIKVYYFTCFADPTDNTKIILGKIKKDRARVVNIKKIPTFKMLMSRFKAIEIPSKFIYPDGIWMIRKSKNEFIPIERPTLSNDNQVIIKPRDIDLDIISMDISADMDFRLKDSDAMKRQQMIMFGLIIAALIFVAVIIWMSYSYHMAGIKKTEALMGVLDKIASRIGITG